MLQVKATLEDQYAGKAANDTVAALTALLKDSPRVNPRKGAPLEALSSVPQARDPEILAALHTVPIQFLHLFAHLHKSAAAPSNTGHARLPMMIQTADDDSLLPAVLA